MKQGADALFFYGSITELHSVVASLAKGLSSLARARMKALRFRFY